MHSDGVVLLYRSTCRKCRFLSQCLALCSFGWIRRIPSQSHEAAELCASYGVTPRKLAVIGYGRVFTGWHAVPAVPALALLALRAWQSARRRVTGFDAGTCVTPRRGPITRRAIGSDTK